MTTLYVGFKTDDNRLQVAINQASSRLNHTTAGWVRMLVMRELQQQGLLDNPYGVPVAASVPAPKAVPSSAKAVPDTKHQQILDEMRRELDARASSLEEPIDPQLEKRIDDLLKE